MGEGYTGNYIHQISPNPPPIDQSTTVRHHPLAASLPPVIQWHVGITSTKGIPVSGDKEHTLSLSPFSASPLSITQVTLAGQLLAGQLLALLLLPLPDHIHSLPLLSLFNVLPYHILSLWWCIKNTLTERMLVLRWRLQCPNCPYFRMGFTILTT